MLTLRAARLEERQNEENARELVGSRVLFGQPFQMLHVNSNKFLTVRAGHEACRCISFWCGFGLV